MKKYIFLALLTMGVSSCQLVDVLDQKPEFEADLDGAITTPAAVELALNGIYYSLPGNGFNVIFPTVSGSFKAGTMWRQEIVSAGNAVYYSERMLPTLSFSDATEWDADYAVIKNANFLETACNRMSDGEFSGNRRAEVLGEIAYLRALAYFNILVRYCEFWDMNSEYGVVMRNEAPSVSNALKARSSVADSYQYILDQLEIAIEKAPDWKKLSQASKEAAKALKARVLLYAGKYTEAVAAVNDAIDTKHSFRDAKLLFTEEQVKAETARCLGCGASVVDPNKCIGCGLCTTKCEFDAIKLHRELPECSRMVPYEDRLKFVLPNMVKQSIKLKFKKK